MVRNFSIHFGILIIAISGCVSVDPSKVVHSAKDLAGDAQEITCAESLHTNAIQNAGSRRLTDHDELSKLNVVKNIERTFKQAVAEGGVMHKTNAVAATNAEDMAAANQPEKISQGEVRDLAERLLNIGDDADKTLFGTEIKDRSFASGLTTNAVTTADGAAPSDAASIFILYYMDWVNGTFIDRMGNKLAKPDISKRVTNEVLAGVLAIFLEASADQLLRTPVFYEIGSGAHAQTTITTGSVTRVSVSAPGTNYSSSVKVKFKGDGTGAEAKATLNDDGSIKEVTIVNGGSGYTTAPTVSFDDEKRYVNSSQKQPSAAKLKIVQERKVAAALAGAAAACPVGITKEHATVINFVSEKAGNEAGVLSGLLS